MHPSVEQAIGRDRIRKAFKRYENNPADKHDRGIVRAVNSDGSYEVLIDGDVQTARCAPYAKAMVGDRVIVVTTKDGENVLLGRLGGEIGGGGTIDGIVFTPHVSSDGVISWSNNDGRENPTPVNIKGPQGDTGAGIAKGGTSGQVLSKKSGNDYDTEWTDPPSTFNNATIINNLGVGGDAEIVGLLWAGGGFYLDNNKALYGANASGAERSLVGINSSNSYHFGYGGYSANEGTSDIYGNSINIRSKGDIKITSPTAGLSNRQYGVNKVLWSGASYMNASQTATLSEAASAQPNGIVLVWSYYSNGAVDDNFSTHFIPKAFVANFSGKSYSAGALTVSTAMAKHVFITDTKITGYSLNNQTAGVASGTVSAKNSDYVLRYVLGV